MKTIKCCKPIRAILLVCAAALLTGGYIFLALTAFLSNYGFYRDRSEKIYGRIADEYMSEYASNIRDVYVDNPNYTLLKDEAAAGTFIDEMIDSEDMTFELSAYGKTICGKPLETETLTSRSFGFPSELIYLGELSDQLRAGMLPKVVWNENGAFPKELSQYVNPEGFPSRNEADEADEEAEGPAEEPLWVETNIPHLYLRVAEMELYWLTGDLQIVVRLMDGYHGTTVLGMRLQLAETAYTYRNVLPIAGGIALVLGLLLGLLYLFTAGYVLEENAPALRGSFPEKLPFDLTILGWLCLTAILLGEIVFDVQSIFYMIYDAVALLSFGILTLLFLRTFIVRCRLKCLGKGWWIVSVWKWVIRWLKKGWSYAKPALMEIPYFWQAVLLLVFLTVVEVFGFGLGFVPFATVWIVEKIIMVPFICYCVYCFNRLHEGAVKIAEGQTDMKTAAPEMIGPFREFAETLDHLEDGLGQAVEERLKSERLRTELITNVSHDIKTPLTGIVSYVDLLKKTELPEGPAKEYVEVLDRQSGKLKKLIEDLVEASKAATGNLSVNPEICDLQVLLSQVLAEYQEKMESLSLSAVMNFPEESVKVLADGRHMWRIFDNLLGNICKYAMPGTRVYLDAQQTGKEVTITFRNISASPLNMAADELLERFTRGDVSRHTEGSGLGLSIASSLTALQKGHMELFVDGDLFKVVLNFPKLNL